MKKKLQHSALVISLLVLLIGFVISSAHAQPTVNTRTDKSAYAPGDSGTVTISIINTSGNPLSIRNITVYYPWAGYDTNGKWLSNANFSYTFSPTPALTTTGANNYSYTTPSFTIPSWWGINSQPQAGTHCPGTTNTKFGLYSHCILLGTNSSRSYDGFDFGVPMALAVYNPSTLSAIQEWIPVATLVVLVVATAILAMVMLRLGNLSKKQ